MQRFQERCRAAGLGLGLLALQAAASAQGFPATVPLPDGWSPEGIVAGRGPLLYAASRATGGLYAFDPRTGA